MSPIVVAARPARRPRGRPPQVRSDTETCCKCLKPCTGDDSNKIGSGLENLIDASKVRGDYWYLELQKARRQKQPLWIHTQCRAVYLNIFYIKKDISKARPLRRELRSAAPAFDPLRDCVLCAEEADMGKVKKQSRERRPNPVHCATTRAFVEELQTFITERGAVDEEWGRVVQARLVQLKAATSDAVAAEVRYHRQCDIKFRTGRVPHDTKKKVGRPVGATDPVKERVFLDLCEYINENEDCQFSLKELEEKSENCYSRQYLKEKLLAHYGEAITITELGNENCVVNFTGFANKLLHDSWYEGRIRDSDAAEKRRIVKLAAEIIVEGVRQRVCRIDKYPSMEHVLDYPLPDTLQCFLETLVTTKSTDTAGVERRRNALGQALMFACRSRSFLPPTLLGASAHLHHVYASRGLIDFMYQMGFGVSYSEVSRYEYNLVQAYKDRLCTHCWADSYVQFCFDNADFNTKTLDGHNTFHCMGGLRLLSRVCDECRPKCDDVLRQPLPDRVANIDWGRFGVPIKHYQPRPSALKEVPVKKIQTRALLKSPPPTVLKCKILDALWLAGHYLRVPEAPSWNGYMKAAMRVDGEFHVTGIEVLPFINLKPTNPSALYSALMFAAEEVDRKDDQDTCFVTFDQQLYTPAVDIVASDGYLRKRVVVRLGTFHLLMNALKAVNYVMQNTGLQDLWETKFAASSVKAMLADGKPYDRLLRAHFKTQQALGGLLLESAPVDNKTAAEAKQLHQAFLHNEVTADEVAAADCAVKLANFLEEAGDAAANKSRTAALWWQYYRLIALLRMYIRAERTACWDLHLECVSTLLLLFHAAGRVHYAKAAHVYLQQMNELSGSNLRAAREGRWVARRQRELWAGIQTDLVIEQDLMRPMKGQGGLTRNRGLADNVVAKWIMTRPAMLEVSTTMERFTGMYRTTSEQHNTLRPSRQKIDFEVYSTFLSFFKNHCPFPVTDGIRNIATNTLGDSKVNCDRALEIGEKMLKNAFDKTWGSFSVAQKSRVTTLSFTPRPAKRGEDTEAIDVNLFFLRMNRAGVPHDAKLKEYLSYDLAAFSPPFFDSDGLMRRTKKAALTQRFDCEMPEANLIDAEALCEALGTALGPSAPAGTSLPVQPEPHTTPAPSAPAQTSLPVQPESHTVVDGGYLLHVVPWPPKDEGVTYGNLCSRYVQRVQRLGPRPLVVFDGYGVGWTTKAEEQRRRAAAKGVRPCVDIDAEDDARVSVKQEDFLANAHNKASFISLLKRHLRAAGVSVKQANADADVDIIEAAIGLDTPGRRVTVIVTDTDVISGLIARAREDSNIHVPRGKRVFRIGCIARKLGWRMRKVLLVIHALSGCDTTSALLKKGKLKLWDLIWEDLQKNNYPSLYEAALVFMEENADQEKIKESGELLIMLLYSPPKGAKKCESLDELRVFKYKQAIKTKKTAPSLQDFPPTSDAARMHSYRAYLQVQQWLGNSLDPLAWGWMAGDDSLVPMPRSHGRPRAPPELMSLLFCECDKGGCRPGTNCSCRKAGMPCQADCTNCEGRACNNVAEDEEDEQDL